MGLQLKVTDTLKNQTSGPFINGDIISMVISMFLQMAIGM